MSPIARPWPNHETVARRFDNPCRNDVKLVYSQNSLDLGEDGSRLYQFTIKANLMNTWYKKNLSAHIPFVAGLTLT
jgi:hypothetical protein